MNTFILILIMSTSSSSQSGAAGVTPEFNSLAACESAQNRILKHNRDYVTNREHILLIGCFKK